MSDVRYAGHRVGELDLVHMGARYYSPLLGRFVSPDPTIFYWGHSVQSQPMLQQFITGIGDVPSGGH